MMFFVFACMVIGLFFHLSLFPVLLAAMVWQSALASVLCRSLKPLIIGGATLMLNLSYLMLALPSANPADNLMTLAPATATLLRTSSIVLNVIVLIGATFTGIQGPDAMEAPALSKSV